MKPIVILTDSAADIDASMRQSLDIEMVPLKVLFGSESFLDSVTIQAGDFYKRLKQSEVMPTTSQPSPAEFADTYQKIAAKHGSEVQIIGIFLSAALSGTYQSAVIGKSMLDDPIDITLIDSKKASFVHGLVVVEAARAVREGKSKQQVLDLIERLLHDIQVYFMVDTLEYLQKGGRIGKASALLGSLLNIKPILTLDPTGVVTPFERVRGSKKAIARIKEELRAYAQDQPVKVAVVHADSRTVAEDLLEQIKGELPVTESFVAEIGPVIGTHAGPGTIGCLIVKDR
ncbi:DegV family protein [Brevibacillus humidisoli]|uniref:DegV family protein n=1 Tax=Brevibacillus humidisoli TaxID=2895522 RepID=UPI001E528BB2|nr:DegV family protein [Brevibacillus humidisoli]UFJ41994.1 DegV family protein [Brevibacillus humidisoli]